MFKTVRVKFIISCYIIASVEVWLLAAIIDYYTSTGGNSFAGILFFNIPSMTLFHRLLLILIALFIVSTFFLFTTAKKLKFSEIQLINLNNTKDKLFKVIAHDFKSPFTGVLSMSEMLKDEWDDLSKDDVRDIGESMYYTSKKLYDYFENLMIWAKMQLNEINLILDNVYIHEQMKSVLEIYRLNLEKKNISVNMNIAPDLTAFTDKNVLHLVLRNIIDNSIKYTNNGGYIVISSETSDDDDFTIIKVRDNGVGISDKDLKEIFRIDNTNSPHGTYGEQGSGIGLAICKEMLDKCGGSIEIESEMNKGTTVNIFLLHKYSAKLVYNRVGIDYN